MGGAPESTFQACEPPHQSLTWSPCIPWRNSVVPNTTSWKNSLVFLPGMFTRQAIPTMRLLAENSTRLSSDCMASDINLTRLVLLCSLHRQSPIHNSAGGGNLFTEKQVSRRAAIARWVCSLPQSN